MTRPVVIVEPAQRDEDRAEVIDLDFGFVVVLADGAGGRSGGREAAEAVVAGVRARARQLEGADSDRCVALLQLLDRELAAQGHGGETTAVLAVVRGQSVRGASVGDSGAWILRPDGYVNDLTEDQVRKPLLGCGSAAVTPLHGFMYDGYRLLVASDGLLKYAGRERLRVAGLTGPVAQAAKGLVTQVRLPRTGLQDDVSLVLWEYGLGP